MKNKILLLVLELREMLAAGDSKTLQDFCESGHPAVIGELISAVADDADQALIGHADISNLMSGPLSKTTVHSHHTDWNRWHNPATRRVAP